MLGFAQAVSAPLVHVLIAVLALHHHDIVYRTRQGRRPQEWVLRAGLGWEGRTLFAAVAGLSGLLPFAYAAPAAYLGVLFGAESVGAEQSRQRRDGRPEGRGSMIGMVLAAGAGRRLRPYTDTLPKALVPVDGETTILDIALGNLAEVGLTDVVIVVGYCAGAVEERKAGLQERYGVNITLVHNDKAEEWNNAYSMWLAREHFSKGVLMVNGDTVHPVSVEKTLLANRGPDILLAVDDVKTLADEEMKVILDGEGHLKTITKLMDPSTANGEYIGATLVEPAAAEPLADALKAVWERDPDLYYEDGYQEHVNRGGRIGVAPIGEVAWVEVDDHDDLEKARRIAKGY